MATNPNQRVRRRQWLLFAAVVTVLTATAFTAAWLATPGEGSRTTVVEKPTTKPLSVGVSQADRDAAAAQESGEVVALRKLLDQAQSENTSRTRALEEKLKLLQDRERQAAAPLGAQLPAPAGGWPIGTPFQQAGTVPQPEPRAGASIGASPGSRSASNTSQLESISISAAPSKPNPSLIDRASDQIASAASDFGRQQQVTRDGASSRKNEEVPLRAGSKEGETFIPAGTYIRAVLLNGLDAPTGGQAQSNPHPLLLQLADDAVLPNAYRAALKNCMVTAAGYGDIAAERAYIKTDHLACIDEDGGAIDVSVKGYIAGEDGKTGMRGRIVEKTGRIMANALYAAVGSGIGQAFKQQGIAQTTNALGGVSETVTDGFRAGFGTGISKAFDRLSDYYIKVAEHMFPVVEINGGRIVDVVLTQGVTIERKTRAR